MQLEEEATQLGQLYASLRAASSRYSGSKSTLTELAKTTVGGSRAWLCDVLWAYSGVFVVISKAKR